MLYNSKPPPLSKNEETPVSSPGIHCYSFQTSFSITMKKLASFCSADTSDSLNTADSMSDSGESDQDVPQQKAASKSNSSRVRKPPSKLISKAGAKKRPGAMAAEKSSKKLKAAERGRIVEEQGKKSVLIQRVWNDEDEIALLRGVIEHGKKKEADQPVDFHDFVKGMLQIEVDSAQIKRKLRSLKERYSKTLSNKKSRNPHEKLLAEFGAEIWGNNAEIQIPRQSKSTSNLKTAGGKKGGGYLDVVCSSVMDEELVKLGLVLCNEDEREELEEKWGKLRMEEGEIAVKRAALTHESVEMITAALRRSGELLRRSY